jgi:hypothetical protein
VEETCRPLNKRSQSPSPEDRNIAEGSQTDSTAKAIDSGVVYVQKKWYGNVFSKFRELLTKSDPQAAFTRPTSNQNPALQIDFSLFTESHVEGRF